MNRRENPDNPLARKFNACSLIRFAFPTIAMMLFMGLYTMTDTVFAARFVNEYALSAINIVCPVINFTVGLGTMLAAGGNAVISRKMGSGRLREARENFTLLILTGAVLGVLITGLGLCCLDPLLYRLGASRLLFPYCRTYLKILLFFIPANLIQTLFQNFFVTAGRPGIGFAVSFLAGLSNIVFDYIFMGLAGMGIAGAALGTGIGYLLPGIAGLLYFSPNKGSLSFGRPRFDGSVLTESCFNGSSEMVSQLAAAVTTLLFNRTMLSLAGENGVAAITIIIYSQFLLSTLYIGYSMGVAPVIGYNYGSRNREQLKILIRICIRFIMAVSAAIFLLCLFGSRFIAALFVNRDSQVYRLAAGGFSLFSFSFLFCGLNIFTSALFTALSKGRISAVLSLLRTFGFVTAGLLILPKIWGLTGVWLAVPIAEGLVFLISVGCLFVYRDFQISLPD